MTPTPEKRCTETLAASGIEGHGEPQSRSYLAYPALLRHDNV